MNMDRGPCLGLGVDGDLRAGARGEASVQLQIDQHGAGGGQLCGRQVDLHVREEVRAVGLDPILAECCLDGLGHEIGAAAVDVFRQRVDVDAYDGGGHRHDLDLDLDLRSRVVP